MRKKYFLFVFLLFLFQEMRAQVGINTAVPSPNAALDVGVSSDRIGGFMPPSVTEAQRDAIPVTAADDGLMLYVTVPCGNRRLQLFNGAALAWEDVMSWAVPYKVWDFGNDGATWPATTGIGTTPIVVDNLGLVPIISANDFGEVNNSNVTFSDGFTTVRRFRMNGPSYIGSFVPMPTRRYLYLGVSGPCRIKVWFRSNTNGDVRTLYVTDGAVVVGSETTNTGGNGDLAILEATYIGGPTTLYVFNDLSCNLYKLEVCGALVSTN
ncbi:MAG: hypothetical protein Q8K02_12825 [Flavobacterium sp.]|nr:hypothetical protein [Flavobacterium sp.]